MANVITVARLDRIGIRAKTYAKSGFSVHFEEQEVCNGTSDTRGRAFSLDVGSKPIGRIISIFQSPSLHWRCFASSDSMTRSARDRKRKLLMCAYFDSVRGYFVVRACLFLHFYRLLKVSYVREYL